MRILVVYYSRTGNTRIAAEALAVRLGADLEELREDRDRSGLLGYLAAAREAMMRNDTVLLATQRNPAIYDLVILAQPVWAFTAVPAMRTYVQQHLENIRKVALVATQDGAGAKQTFAAMEEMLGQAPVATLILNSKAIRNGQMDPALGDFIARIQERHQI